MITPESEKASWSTAVLFVEVGLGTKTNDTYSPVPLSGEWSRGAKTDADIKKEKKKKSLVDLFLYMDVTRIHVCQN